MSRNLRFSEEQFLSFQKKQPAKTSKYGNVKTTDVNGITHDSKKEAKRWTQLRAMFRAGEIVMLGRQVEFMLAGGIIYKADFVYCPTLEELIVEDVKGVRTTEYKMKAKLMKERFGITILET